MTTTTNEHEMRPVECDCCGGTWGYINAQTDEHDSTYDCITELTKQRNEWRDAAKWSEGQHQHWKTVAEAATAQRDAAVEQMHEWENASSVYEASIVRAERERDAAVRERDALRHELKIAQTTVLVERDYIEQLRAERDEAVRDAQVVREIRARRNVVVEVSAELLKNGAFTDQPLHIMLTENGDGTHLLTFRVSDTIRELRQQLDASQRFSDEAVRAHTECYRRLRKAWVRLAACERVVEAAYKWRGAFWAFQSCNSSDCNCLDKYKTAVRRLDETVSVDYRAAATVQEGTHSHQSVPSDHSAAITDAMVEAGARALNVVWRRTARDGDQYAEFDDCEEAGRDVWRSLAKPVIEDALRAATGDG